MLYDRKLYGQMMLEHILDLISFLEYLSLTYYTSGIFPTKYLFKTLNLSPFSLCSTSSLVHYNLSPEH